MACFCLWGISQDWRSCDRFGSPCLDTSLSSTTGAMRSWRITRGQRSGSHFREGEWAAPHHWRRTAILAAAAGVVAAVLVTTSSAEHVVAQSTGSGSTLLDENFQGSSVPDPNWVALGDACLTGATQAPPAGQSNLGPCHLTQESPPKGGLTGYLQLTDAEYDREGAVLYNQALPSRAGVDVTFEQWQYGGSSSFAGPAGADGIGFFLVNGAANLTSPGADGGSLGYAQRNDSGIIAGVHAGVLGVGLDVYGNYANDAEDRGYTCAPPARPGVGSGGYYSGGPGFPNVISVRGPGEGTGGYCWLAGTVTAPTPQCTASNWGTIPTPLECGSSTLTAYGTLYGGPANPISPPPTTPPTPPIPNPPEGSMRTVRVQVTPAGLITVWVDFNSGNGLQQVLQYLDPNPLPPTFKFGFSSSTGGSSAVHLIRTVAVSSVDTLPEINLEKVVDQTTTQPPAYWAGATVPYNFVVTNTGDTVLTKVEVKDLSADDPPGISCPSTTLASAGTDGSSMTCKGQHTITSAEAASPTFTNVATVTGQAPPGDTIVTDTSDETVNIANSYGISIVKSATIDGAAAPPAVAKVGDPVVYSFAVTNTGNTPLTNVMVADSKVGSLACGSGTLAAGGHTTCTASYTVTQADIDAGSVSNSATASATSPSGEIGSQPGQVDIPTDSSPGPIHLTKVASMPDVPSGQPVLAGDVVDYQFTVTNEGNVTLDNIAIQDSVLGVSGVVCDRTTLGPSGTTSTPPDFTDCHGTYQLTQANVDAGRLTNYATATGQTPSGYAPNPGETLTSNQAEAPLDFPPHPSLALQKTASVKGTGPRDTVKAGDTITYTYALTNTGNVTLSDLSVNDDLAGLSPIVCGSSKLAPLGQTTCTALYHVTQADIDAGSVTNMATARGTDPERHSVPSNPGSVTVDLPASASLFLKKTASIAPNGAGLNAAGATITYSYTLENTGTVTLNALQVSDDLPGLSSITCPTSLGPGDHTTCTATYVVTQADVDRGDVLNTATASASSSRGSVESNEARARVLLDQVRSLSLSKSGVVTGTGPDGIVVAGDTITYTYTVTNTGTVTVRSLHVIDSLRPLSPITCHYSSLEPGHQVTCTATYTVRQADLNNGRVLNTAIAWGLGARGAVVVSNTAHHLVPLTQAPALTLTKAASLTATAGTLETDGDVTVPEVNDIIHYSFEVENTGNVTITHIAIKDSLPGLVPSSPTCASTTLAPGESTTCRADYTLTQADFDRGGVFNAATATGQGANGEDVSSNRARAKVPLARTRLLTLTKTGEVNRTNGGGAAVAGDTVTYTYELLNNGDVTLTPSVVNDDRLGAIDCRGPTLAPGDAATCTATYTLTQADIDAGQVVNVATGTASTMQNTPVVSNEAQEIVPIEAAPSLVLTKTAVPNGLSAGDTIGYQYQVTNAGNVDVSGVSVTDNRITSPSVVTCGDTVLVPGQTTTCTATYTITAANVSAGNVTNVATAGGTTADGHHVVSAPKSTTVTIPPVPPAPSPRLAVQKSGLLHTTGTQPKPGDAIGYSYVVTNTGNVTVSNIAVSDSLAGLSAVTCPVTSLAPGDSTTCTATYKITQADIDAGHVANTAFATGSPSTGGTTTSPPSSADVRVPQFHELSLVKTSVPARTPAVAGTNVTYDYAVTNTGNTTIHGTRVTDLLPGLSAVSCPGTTLAPGKTMNCSATYVVTQADVDNGSLVNVATAEGRGADNSKVVSPPSSTTVPLGQTASISVSKSGALSPGPIVVGSVIKYSFTVMNAGAVTLHNLGVTDSQPGLSTIDCPERALAPGDTVVCTATYAVTLDDLNRGSVSDTAVATAQTPSGDDVTSPPGSADVPLHQDPHLTLKKYVAYASVKATGPGPRPGQAPPSITAMWSPTMGTLRCRTCP